MKKNLKISLIVVLVIALIVWWVFLLKRYNDSRVSPSAYISPDGTFALEIPKTWSAQIPDAWSIVVTFINNDINTTSQAKPYINIAKWWLQWDIDQVYAETVGKYKRLFKKFEIVEETEIKLGGEWAKKLVFDGTLGGRLVRYTVVLTRYEDVIYTLTSSSSQTDYEAVKPTLDGVLGTWEFLEK